MLELFAITSFILFLSGSMPYVLSVKRGQTNPHRMSVYIFLILGFLNVATQLAAGATLSLIYPFFTLAINIFILLLMTKSEIGRIRPIDIFSLAASLVIIVLWGLTESAALAIVLLILVNIIAKVLVIKKVYEYPRSEPIKTYLFWIAGSFFTMLSVGSTEWALLLPAFNNIVTLSVIVFTMVVMRTGKLKKKN